MSYFRNTRNNMERHYDRVLYRYETNQPKISLSSRGFLHSYGDDCEIEKKEKKEKKRKQIEGKKDRKDKKKKKKVKK
jgi:hypothetical protein